MKKRMILLTLSLCLGLAAPAAAVTVPNPFQDITNLDPLHQAILWAVTQNTGTTVSFTDVDQNDTFYDAIVWAAGKNIAAGYENNTFRSGETCTRAQIAAFLWRAAGKPALSSSLSACTDVTSDMNTDLYTASLWMAGKGAAKGETFDPNGACTRLMAVEFLWLAAGSPDAADASTFTDAAGSTAVNWAVSKGITNGYPDGTFRPDDACTRGQIMAFLYRAGEGAFKA